MIVGRTNNVASPNSCKTARKLNIPDTFWFFGDFNKSDATFQADHHNHAFFVGLSTIENILIDTSNPKTILKFAGSEGRTQLWK